MTAWLDAIRSITGTTRTRVGPATVARTMTRDGVSWKGVEVSPVELHKRAGIDRNDYAIARCVKSEVGDDNPAACLAIACAIRNAAARKSIEPYHYCVGLTSSRFDWTEWLYGEQRGRRVSTRQDPTERTLEAARLSRDADVARFVDGATVWFDPRVQDSGRQGDHSLSWDAIGIAKKWTGEGMEWIGPLPGIDTYREAAFLRPVKGRGNAEGLLSVIELGRAGKPTIGVGSPHQATSRVAALNLPWWAIVAGGAVAIVTLA